MEEGAQWLTLHWALIDVGQTCTYIAILKRNTWKGAID